MTIDSQLVARFAALHPPITPEAIVAASKSPYRHVGVPEVSPEIPSMYGTSTRSLTVLETYGVAMVIVLLSLLIGGLVVFRLAQLVHERNVTATVSMQRGPRSDDEGDSPDEGERSSRHVISPSTPSTLLSDEGVIIKLLIERDGQIRQHQITSETDWSKSKVSRTVSKMHENGMIEKTSSGRENIIHLTESAWSADHSLGFEESLR